jgi:hypothetical protein
VDLARLGVDLPGVLARHKATIWIPTKVVAHLATAHPPVAITRLSRADVYACLTELAMDEELALGARDPSFGDVPPPSLPYGDPTNPHRFTDTERGVPASAIDAVAMERTASGIMDLTMTPMRSIMKNRPVRAYGPALWRRSTSARADERQAI